MTIIWAVVAGFWAGVLGAAATLALVLMAVRRQLAGLMKPSAFTFSTQSTTSLGAPVKVTDASS